jgi:starch-binding outer membrane protein SusE/F
MKNFFQKIAFVAVVAFAFASCTKDETLAVANPGAGSNLSATVTTVVLAQANATQTATVLNWTATQFGYDAAVKYTVQADKKGNNFAKPVQVLDLSALTYTYTVSDLNTAMNKLGLAAGSVADVEIRIKATVSAAVAAVYSNVLAVKITPYFQLNTYPSLWVPGSYQSWTPASAPKIASVTDNKIYEGYVNFGVDSAQFKFTDQPNWTNGIFGDVNATGITGTIGTPGENIRLIEKGYYRLTADLTAKTYKAVKTVWAVVGDATPNGWNTETPLTFDAVTNTWKITITLTNNKIKFRANNAWTINLGDTGGDGTMEQDGTDIQVPGAGTYNITLNLSSAGNYTYSLVK